MGVVVGGGVLSAQRRVAPCLCVCVFVGRLFFYLVAAHGGPKCTSGLCSGVQGSVSCSPEAAKLQSSQAEKCNGVWKSRLHLSHPPPTPQLNPSPPPPRGDANCNNNSKEKKAKKAWVGAGWADGSEWIAKCFFRAGGGHVVRKCASFFFF